MRKAVTLLLLSLVLASCSMTAQEAPAPKHVYHANPLLEKFMGGYLLPDPAFDLPDPRLAQLIDYDEYGTFHAPGSVDYRYVINDMAGLREAAGEGLYPNTDGVLIDPVYLALKDQALLNVDPWVSLSLEGADLRRAFYIWAQAQAERGTQAFFTAEVLKKSGHILPAVKAYYAALVHFPKSYCWAADRSFVWYIAQAAIQNIETLTRDHPQLGLELVGAYFTVENGYDPNVSDDVIAVNPGRLVRKTVADRLAELPNLNALDVVERRGDGRVQLVKFENGHWMMLVDDKPFYMHAVSYNPTAVGLGPQNDRAFMGRWMFSDLDGNGRNDAAYDAWVDANLNHQQDADEHAVGDFQLMKDAGINAIRLYPDNDPVTEYDPSLINKPLLREMYDNYGIGVIAGDYLGAYTLGSGATYEEGTDYTDPAQRASMKACVRAKVMDLKDEPFVLMWVLGNENNMASDYTGHNATRTNAADEPEAYARFLDEVAAMIHEIDGNHPVAVGNVELGLLDYYDKYAPKIDIIGVNSYRGTDGFGTLWQDAKALIDRPLLITEYGCDAYYAGKGVDGAMQRGYFEGKYRDIIFNQAGAPGTGNAIGGVLFEYLDEWWKNMFGDPVDAQDPNPQFPASFPDGYDHEEWFGIVGQGDGSHSPFLRQPREAYDYFRNL